jgi:acyl-CoA synthetase (AMP-forming)/AMP-acid ligase II
MASELLIGDVIRTAALRLPDNVAIALDDEALTFAELYQRSLDLAQRLLAAGVQKGDRVAWRAATSVHAAVVYGATALIGAVFLPINPAYTPEEEARILAHAEPALMLDPEPVHGIDCSALPLPGGGPLPLPTVSEHDACVIFYTSGTTGEPKGCILTHRSERLRAANSEPWPRGATICMFPQFHMAGWSFALRTWLSGDAMVYVRRADAADLLSAVERHRAHQLYCVPAVWRRILDHDRSGYDLASLRYVDTGTSAVTTDLLRDLAAAFPEGRICIAYGSTEAGPVCMLGPDHLFSKNGSVGLPYPGAEIRLDEQGQMWVRNPWLFAGYFRNEDATRAALVDGWYATGDLAERDADGFFSIVGRAREIIRTGGESVAPVEVDLVLQAHPELADAAVAGVPDPDWGEVIVAFVVPRGGNAITLEALRSHCQASLAPYKAPRRLMVLSSLPRTGATRQIERKRLIALYAEAVAQGGVSVP